MIAVQAVSEHGGKTLMETTHLRLTRDRRHLAQELARSVVGSVAGHETPDFDQRAAAHFRPRLPWTRPNQFDPQGMAGELATPVALAVATALLGALSTTVVARLERAIGGIRRRGRRQAPLPQAAAPERAMPTAGPARLSATDLAQWRAIALSAALECAAPEDLARRVADATLAKLVQHLADGEDAPGSVPPDAPEEPDPTNPAPERDDDSAGDGCAAYGS